MIDARAARPSRISRIGLTTEEVQALQLEQGDVTLWEDVASVARAFWGSGSAPTAAHHLLMTVGNFKRQGGTIIHLRQPVDHGQPGESRPDCEVDGSVLSCDDEETWRAFGGRAKGGVGGFGVATTSTLLSALWPDRHMIIDRRARDALVGLRGVGLKDWYGRVRNASSGMTDLEVTWDDYKWYRRHVHDAVQNSGVKPVALERALFEVDRRRSKNHRKKGVTWQTFGEQLVSVAIDAAHSLPDGEVG